MRNINCPFYRKCLDYAVKQYLRSWECSDCQYHKTQGDMDETDFTEYHLLLWGIFKPDLYRKYREAEAMKRLKGAGQEQREKD